MSKELIAIDRRLSSAVDRLRFAEPVAYVYNPLAYARVPHEAYLSRYGKGPKSVVFLGMNPGPFGMGQTGVPFGDIGMVRDWLAIEGKVGAPPVCHPKRPISGFACARGEVSGQRFWGWARDRFVTPEAFFERCFVLNYCPLLFMEAGGRNRTPDKLPREERDRLFFACDEALQSTVNTLQAEWVVAIGKFAEARARAVFQGKGPRIGSILHPSPASPAANRGWKAAAEGDLKKLGLRFFFDVSDPL